MPSNQTGLMALFIEPNIFIKFLKCYEKISIFGICCFSNIAMRNSRGGSSHSISTTMKKTLHKLALLFLLIVGAVNSISATNYAVIISGNTSSERYRNDCSLIYQTLLGKGYEENRIYLALSGGSSLDLNGNDSDETVSPATIDVIEHLFSELSYIMTDQDDLFIYVTGPGCRNEFGQSGIILWDEEVLRGNLLAHLLESLSCRTINIVMQQDYAGGFIDDVITLNNVVITTACNATEKSRIKAPHNYVSEFTFRWVSAIINDSPCDMLDCSVCSPISNPHPNHDPDIYINDPYNTECVVADDGDANRDGYVTMKEAFNYAEHYDQTLEHSQIASNPSCFSRALALDELLYSYDCSPALVDGWDLYMKDNGLDIGEEPNTTTKESWISDAIWCEQNGHWVDVMMSGGTYDVCVYIENRGNAPSPDSVKLYAHWTKATIGGTWPWGWYGENSYDCNGTMVPRGGLIDTVYLPSIGPGETYTARIPWTTPNVETYMPCLNFAENVAELWHYCLLARIVDEQEQPDETIANMELKEFVLNYNNVVSRNVTIMYSRPDNLLNSQLTGVVALANPIEGDNSSLYSLKCKIIGQDGWENFASVNLTFDSAFYNSQPFMSWHDCDAYGDGLFELYDNAQFDNIQFPMPENGLFPLKLDVTYYYTYALENYPEFRINLELQDEQEQLVGGERFYFNVGQQSLPNNITRRYILDENSNTEIGQKPIDVEDILDVYVYNVQGQFLIKSTSDKIESLHLQQGIYILRYVGEEMSYSIKIIK